MSSSIALHFTASNVAMAQEAYHKLIKRYHHVEKSCDADMIIALGGDGFMLQILQKYINQDIPIYGMNCGSVGFLMNGYNIDHLIERLEMADQVCLHPLSMKAYCLNGDIRQGFAFNEISAFRQTRQAADINILIDGIIRMKNMICDGVILSTAAGSTAYNLSANGPIIPVGAETLALTPISVFRPRRWHGALLPSRAQVEFIINDHEKRPVSVATDSTEVRNILRIKVRESKNHSTTILFDPEHNMEERILREQFAY